jgi:DNA polymerase III sliding clamp (beta) subunit (PCNA family)
MKITFQTPELQKRLGQLGAVIARTSQEALYVSVRIFSNAAGIMFLQGADGDSTLTLKLPNATTDDKSANMLVEYARLNAIVQRFTAPQAVLALNGESEAVLLSGRSRARLSCLPTAPFMSLPVVSTIPTEEEIAVSGGVVLPLPGLKGQIEQVLFTVPKEQSKYVMASALIFAKDKILTVAGCDSKMIGMSLAPIDSEFPSFTIPKTALELLSKLDGGALNLVTVIDSESMLTFSTDCELLTYGQTHAEFPPYQRVIPEAGSHVLCITLKNKETFLAALETIRPSCLGLFKGVAFSVKSATELCLTAARVDKQATGVVFTDMADESLDADITGTAVKFELDIDRLLPFAKQATFPVTLYVKSSSTPVDIHANGGTPDKPVYRLVVMPMNIESGVSSTPISVVE